ncbi:putative DD41D transposase [Trichonephila clavipes]|nr:putative DD41D transposase [Trichonephila clavipes]
MTDLESAFPSALRRVIVEIRDHATSTMDQNVKIRRLLWQRFQNDGTHRPLLTAPNEDQHLAITAKKKKKTDGAQHPTCPVSSAATSLTVSKQTVYSRLEHSLYVCRPVRRVPLTATDCRQYCQVIYSQIGLAMHQNDHQARRRFLEWAQNEMAVVPDFHKRILFSDEAHFWLNGYVNKQNCRIWSESNPQVYVETPLHPEKLTVWCALWAGGVLLQKR